MLLLLQSAAYENDIEQFTNNSHKQKLCTSKFSNYNCVSENFIKKKSDRLFLKIPAEKRNALDPQTHLSETDESWRLAFRPRKAKEIADHFHFGRLFPKLLFFYLNALSLNVFETMAKLP